MSSEIADQSSRKGFRQFFLRGLGILLPTVLTIWILVAVYNFIEQKIAAPINQGIRWAMASWTAMTAQQVDAWWQSVRIGQWEALNLTGLLVAIMLIYVVGRVLGGFIGRGVIHHGESLLLRVPLFKQIYPYVKQVTDFFVGDSDSKMKFSRVVAVQYPRKGIWAVGLVTGDTMRDIESAAHENCITVFVPSSPTPFTGYVITVPKVDTINLPITIDEAFRFCVSGGVIVPDAQRIVSREQLEIETDDPVAATADRSDASSSQPPRTQQPTGGHTHGVQD